MLVNRSVDCDCNFLFCHSIQQNWSANWHKQCRAIWDESSRVLNDFNVVFVVIDIKKIIEFVEDFDSAGVRVAVQSVSARCEKKWFVISTSQSTLDCHSICIIGTSVGRRKIVRKLPLTLRYVRHCLCRTSTVRGRAPLTPSWTTAPYRIATSKQHEPLLLSIFRWYISRTYRENKMWRDVK